MGRKPIITEEIKNLVLRYIESDENGLEQYLIDPKTKQTITKHYRKKISGQTDFQELNHFLKDYLGMDYDLSRRTIHKLLEDLRDQNWIENKQPYKGIWAITQPGKDLVRVRNVFEDLRKLASQNKIPDQYIVFDWTPDRERVVAAYLFTRITEPEVVSSLYLMRRSINDDREFAKRIGQFIRLSLSAISKIGTTPELAKGIQGIFNNPEVMQTLADLIRVFQD